MSNVVPFPSKREPDCRICVLAISDGGGTYCREFQEEILLESIVAPDCPEFEDDPLKL